MQINHMKKKIFFAATTIATLALFSACTKPHTPYVIEWRFEDTDMKTTNLHAYEMKGDQMNSQKWRSEFHKFDTIVSNGDTHIYAYGQLKDAALPGADGICISIENIITLQSYNLDTIFPIVQGKENFITITPDMTWTKH